MEYNKISVEKVNAFEQDLVARQKEIEEAYRYDNSLRCVSVKEAEHAFVTDRQSLDLWGVIYDCFMELARVYCGKHNHQLDADRVRIYRVEDPRILKEHGAVPVEVFYRTCDLSYKSHNVAFSPWPDIYVGEFFLKLENEKPVGAVMGLQDRLGNSAHVRRERITDYAAFPKTLEEAKEVSRNHLWFPGTNVAIEDMTDNLYRELAQTLPDDMAF